MNVPVIKTDATNAQTGTKAVYKFETKKEVAHLTNLDIGGIIYAPYLRKRP